MIIQDKDFKKKQKELTELNWDGEEDPLSEIIKPPGTGLETAEAEVKGSK